jgi:hypothetical protein
MRAGEGKMKWFTHAWAEMLDKPASDFEYQVVLELPKVGVESVNSRLVLVEKKSIWMPLDAVQSWVETYWEANRMKRGYTNYLENTYPYDTQGVVNLHLQEVYTRFRPTHHTIMLNWMESISIWQLYDAADKKGTIPISYGFRTKIGAANPRGKSFGYIQRRPKL